MIAFPFAKNQFIILQLYYWEQPQMTQKAYCTLCQKIVPEQEQGRNTHHTHECTKGLRNILVKYVIYQVYLTKNFLKAKQGLAIWRSQQKRSMLSEGRKWSREAG